jgi:hypothetical protein
MYYNSLNNALKEQFGRKIYKLSLSTGCSCPNRDGKLSSRGCIFCDGAGAFAEVGSVKNQLVQAKKRVISKAGENAGYIAYFQSFTNTYGDAKRLREMFLEAIEPEDIVAISIATRPDCLPDEILELLSELVSIKPVWVELGLQTIHEKSAEYIRRGYSLPVYDNAVKTLKNMGITVITHQILGLPGESHRMMAETSRYIGQSGADGIKLHLLHVLRGTDLETQWRNGKVAIMELNEYIDVLEECIRNLPPKVVIHRMTGDGDKKTLLAPLWSGDKKRVLNTIRSRFIEDDLVQGSNL